MVAIAIGGLGVYVASFIDMPWWLAAIGGLAILAGIVGYAYGSEALYQRYCEPLGFHSELRPEQLPKNARYAVDYVITGNFRGRPFTLYRESESHSTAFHNQHSRKPTLWSVLEWGGADIQLPKFTLEIDATGTADEQTEKSRAVLGTDTGLAKRSQISYSDQSGVRAVFTKTVCDTLDSLIATGGIEAKPGLLIIRQCPA